MLHTYAYLFIPYSGVHMTFVASASARVPPVYVHDVHARRFISGRGLAFEPESETRFDSTYVRSRWEREKVVLT